MCNSESIHAQLLNHRAQPPSKKASPFSSLPLRLLAPPEVIVDRRHGWVMSVLSFGDFTDSQGSCEVGQQLQIGRRETVVAERGKEQLAVVLLLFVFTRQC